jgi:hypothetical protein
MTKLKILLAVTCLVALTACPGPTPPPALNVTPSGTSIQAGSTAGITLTASLENPGDLTTGGVTWKLTPETGLGTLSAANGPAVKFNAPASVSKNETVTVEASLVTTNNGTLTKTTTLTITPAPVPADVEGKVVDQYGRAVSNVTVRIGSQSQTTRTDGTFKFTNVSKPYDALLIYPGIPANPPDNQPSKSITQYLGVTTDKPNFLAMLSFAVTNKRVITGTVNGGTFPVPSATDTLSVAFGSADGKGGVALTNNNFTTDVFWEQFAGGSTSGKLFGMRVSRNATTGAIDYLYGSKDQTLAALPTGVQDPGVDVGALTLNPTAKGKLEGIFNNPGGWSVQKRVLSVDLGSNAAIRLVDDPSSQILVNYDTPNLTGVNANAKLAFLYQIFNSNTQGSALFYKTGLPASQNLGSIVVDENAFIRTLGPVAGTEFDSNTEFKWESTAPKRIFLLQVTKATLSDPGNNYFVFTTSTSAKLPLGLAGVNASPAGTNYTVTMKAINPVESIDEAANSGTGLADFIYAENTTFPATVNTFNNNFVPKKAEGFIATAPPYAVKSK